jgi:hypothetical protein
MILAFIKTVSLRGGAVVSCLFLFFISRQIAAAVAFLFRRERVPGNLENFHVPHTVIWIISLSLLGVLAGTVLRLVWLEIAAWNVLLVSAFFYLAQGAGILMFFLSRRAISAGMRFLINLFTVIVIFSPGINVVFLAVLILLGIAENWAPLRARALKTNGPSSTPGSGG